MSVDAGDVSEHPVDLLLLVEVGRHRPQLTSGELAEQVVGQRRAKIGRVRIVGVDGHLRFRVAPPHVLGGARTRRAVTENEVASAGHG